MEINWFTVIAQIVNFLILVWLLKRFLYKPVLDAIDARDKKISSQLDDAATLKAEAKKEQAVFRQKNEDFDKEHATKIMEAREAVDLEKQRLFEEVRTESTIMRTKYDALFKQQEQELTEALKKKTKAAVFAIADKTLADLANANLEEQVILVCINRIQNLDAINLEKLKDALNTNQKPITIKSAFKVSTISKNQLEKAIDKINEQQNDFQYVIEPELVGGIEIDADSYQLSWNIDAYLDALKKDSPTN